MPRSLPLSFSLLELLAVGVLKSSNALLCAMGLHIFFKFLQKSFEKPCDCDFLMILESGHPFAKHPTECDSANYTSGVIIVRLLMHYPYEWEPIIFVTATSLLMWGYK